MGHDRESSADISHGARRIQKLILLFILFATVPADGGALPTVYIFYRQQDVF
jgi:hypothetical protein